MNLVSSPSMAVSTAAMRSDRFSRSCRSCLRFMVFRESLSNAFSMPASEMEGSCMTTFCSTSSWNTIRVSR